MRSTGLLAPGGVPIRVRRALRRSGTGWLVALGPTPWFLLTDCLGPPAMAGWAGVPGVLVQLVVVVWLAEPLLARWCRGTRGRAWPTLSVYAVAGGLRAAVWVALTPSTAGFWTDWARLAPSRVLGSVIWLAGSALVVHWLGQVRRQRVDLAAQYLRLSSTRRQDAAGLAEADEELAAVRATTQAALADIRARLTPQLGEAELRGTVAVIEDVVARLVRPASHELAAMPAGLAAPAREELWLRRREIVPAVIRAWPKAAPYQPLLVAALCLPMVLAAELVPPPYDAGPVGLIGLAGLAIQVALLVPARFLLAPRLRRSGAHVGVAVVAASYLMLFAIGLGTLWVVRDLQPASSLEALLAPALVTVGSGGIAAATLVHSREAARARAVIRRTQWDQRRTRQRLWAQRRRLAMALHGRVQANLTAAALVLSAAGDSLEAGGSLDPAVIAQVRHTLTLAAWIDNAPPGAPRERLTSIADVWSGVLQVGLELRPQAEELLDVSRDVADAAVEVLREILLNAVRHGGAASARVVIGLDRGSMVCLRVAERRSGPRPSRASQEPGLGRSLIDSLAVDWAEQDAAEGRITVVLLAGGPTPGVADAAVRLADVADLG